jgi:hypothetical protein
LKKGVFEGFLNFDFRILIREKMVGTAAASGAWQRPWRPKKEEWVETVEGPGNRGCTLLKQGVNEKRSFDFRLIGKEPLFATVPGAAYF